MSNDIFEKLSPQEALKILKQLVKTDKDLKARVFELAERVIREVSIDEICEEVLYSLDALDVQDLWDRAGPSQYGYTSPDEMAVEMVEDALEPFVGEIKKFQDLKMPEEAKRYCMGVLYGIYRYGWESESEFKIHAEDVPQESFGWILEDWEKKSSEADKKAMKEFIKTKCPRWFKCYESN